MANTTTSPSSFSKSSLVLYPIILVWAALIFYFSTATFGSGFTELVLNRELSFFHISVSPRTFHVLDTLQRKVAHLTVYGVLATLLYFTFVGQVSFRAWLRRAAWCVVIAGGYALTDEFHQLFVAGRNASLMDCGIDMVGAMMALALIHQGQPLLQRMQGRSSVQVATKETAPR